MLESLKRNSKGISLMLVCSVCLASGQLLWKLFHTHGIIMLLAGFAVYAVGALAMITAYRYGELSVLQPVNSTSYIFSLLLAALVLREPIGALKIIGVASIICGVIFIGGGSERSDGEVKPE